MAILQKLETSYLAILRFVVIVISGLLLAATLTFSVGALVGLREKPITVQPAPKVAPDWIVTKLTKTQIKFGASATKPALQITQTPVDPNDAEYDRAADAIVSFVSKYGRGSEVSKYDVADILKFQAEKHSTPELVKACAAGLPGVFEKVLSDKEIIELVSRPTWAEPDDDIPQGNATVGRSPIWVMSAIQDQYFRKFQEQADQAVEDEEMERSEQASRENDAMQSMYQAAAAFGAFLLLALLSIIVRVERNLRPLAHLADKPRKPE